MSDVSLGIPLDRMVTNFPIAVMSFNYCSIFCCLARILYGSAFRPRPSYSSSIFKAIEDEFMLRPSEAALVNRKQEASALFETVSGRARLRLAVNRRGRAATKSWDRLPACRRVCRILTDWKPLEAYPTKMRAENKKSRTSSTICRCATYAEMQLRQSPPSRTFRSKRTRWGCPTIFLTGWRTPNGSRCGTSYRPEEDRSGWDACRARRLCPWE